MGCSSPTIVAVNVPAFVPPQPQLPPAAPGLPYVEVGWMYAANPGEFGYGMAAQIWGQQMPDADHYIAIVQINGKQVWTDTIPKSVIPYQYDQITGYWFAPFDNFFNTSNGPGYNPPTGPTVGPSDTMEFIVQACNANGCSSSPTLSIPNIKVGNYGTPPTGIPTQAPTGTTTLQVVSASIANLTLQFSPVAQADSYEIIDMDQGPTFYIEGLNSADSPIKITVPQSLLQSLGLSPGKTINLAVQAKNLIGNGPIGPALKVTLTN